MKQLSKKRNPTSYILYALVLIIFTAGHKAHAQVGAHPDYSLIGIECIEGVLGDSFSFPVNSSTESIPDICHDAAGPAATFGHAFADIVGLCTSMELTDHVTLEVSWLFCKTPVIASTNAGFGTTVATGIDACGPDFRLVGEVFGRARAFDFLLGTEFPSEEGFSDCTGGSSPPIPPAISTC